VRIRWNGDGSVMGLSGVLTAIEPANLSGPDAGAEPGNRIIRPVETVVQALVGWLAIA
jgi:hypothetical protein